MPIDMILRQPSPYGAGHASDVPILFQYIHNDLVWKIMFCNEDPQFWFEIKSLVEFLNDTGEKVQKWTRVFSTRR